MVISESLLIEILLGNICLLIALHTRLVLRRIIRLSNYLWNISLTGIYLLGQMGWFESWSVSSDLNLSALVISGKFRDIIWLVACVVDGRVFLGKLVGWLVDSAGNVTVVLLLDNSIGNSRGLNFTLRVNNINIGSIHVLTCCVILIVGIDNLLTLDLRGRNLVSSLNIARVIIIIADIRLRVNLLSKPKVVILRLALFNLLLSYLLLPRLLIPIGLNSLLSNIILSRLTILINQTFNIPGQLLILAISSHTLDQFLLLGMIEVSIGFIDLGQSRRGK